MEYYCPLMVLWNCKKTSRILFYLLGTYPVAKLVFISMNCAEKKRQIIVTTVGVNSSTYYYLCFHKLLTNNALILPLPSLMLWSCNNMLMKVRD
jgi:hypothetical protein